MKSVGIPPAEAEPEAIPVATVVGYHNELERREFS